jgi:hypothetical protein
MIELILMFCAWLFLAWVVGGRKDCGRDVAAARARILRAEVDAGNRLIEAGGSSPEHREANAECERWAEAYEERARR